MKNALGTRNDSPVATTAEQALTGPVGVRPVSTADRMRSDTILRMFRRLRHGTLELTLPDGSSETLEGDHRGPVAALHVRDGRVVDRYLKHGSVGFAESYIAGEWETPNLADLLELLDRNYDAWSDAYFGPVLARMVARVQHWFRQNSRTGSRRNIHAHYDLGNEFFAAWLDPTMTYSAALFDERQGVTGSDLEAAQRAKYHNLCRMIDLQPGHRLLEIGSGWGGFAMTAAREFGAEVTSITISKAQAELASRRVVEAGLQDQVEIRLVDYRDVEGEYDRVASIEMFEAVGERYWPTYFGKVRSVLKPGGLAGLQIITIQDAYFETYRRGADFIQQYIFPGGMLPSGTALAEQTRRVGLEITDKVAFGRDYARTLGLWGNSFDAAWERLTGLGYDERFRRLWRYYLGYCEAGFRTGSTDVLQLALRRS
jgi:cyclopropane-fatty-acyl-phospholipid synthase